MSDVVRQWLIAYDIRCPRRLARVHRRVSRQALPVQYSVFRGCFSRSQAGELADELAEIIAPEDDVRFYALGRRPWYRWFGPGNLPDAIWLLEADQEPIGAHANSPPPADDD